MDTSTYVATSQLAALERQLDVTANNLANVNSGGFKAERVVFESYLKPGAASDGSEDTSYVIDRGSYLDETQGALTSTGNPLDLALSGPGWFGYETPDGRQAYGRDGRFLMDAQGALRTVDGAQVMAAGGGPLILPPDVAGSVEISADGTISAPGMGVLAQVGVFDLPELQSFERIGGGLFVAPDGQPGGAVPAATTEVLQGTVERSNVDAVREITQLIQIQQAYQRSVNLVNSEDDLRQQVLSRIGRSTNA